MEDLCASGCLGKGTTPGTIAQTYVELTVNRFPSSATVVFDGYLSGPAIKDNTHQRCGKNNFIEQALLKRLGL